MKILIVDDISSERMILKLYLHQLGHEVVEASDGRYALKYIPNIKPDILITDIFMPDIDGIELISKVKELYPDLYIIAMSAGTDKLDISYLEVAEVVGANKILPKPINVDSLKLAIYKCI